MTSLAKPSALDFFQQCQDLLEINMVRMGQLVPVHADNVATVAGFRGNAVAPLTFMLVTHHHYPQLWKDPQQSRVLLTCENFAHQVADAIADEVGRDKIAVINPKKIDLDHPDDYARYMFNVVELSIDMLAVGRQKIEQAPWNETYRAATRIYGALCMMQSAMLCFRGLEKHIGAMFEIGQNPLAISERFLAESDFCDREYERVKPIIAARQPPHP